MLRRLLPTALLVLALCGAARAEDPFEVEAARLRAAVEGGKTDERRDAFDRVRMSADPRAIGLLVGAAQTISRERDLADVRVRKAEEDLDAADAALDRENRAYGKLEAPAGAAVDRHVERVEALKDRLRGATIGVTETQAEAARRRRELSEAGAAAVGVLARLEDADVPGAVERLERAWAKGGASTVEDRARFVDAIERKRHPAVDAALRRTSFDPDADPRVRAVALSARTERRDADLLADALGLLADPAWLVEAAAVEALRQLHERRAIEPLIAMLGRDDLGRVREDVHRALQSLTGERHGPYRQPWADWWEISRHEFEMPKRPAAAQDLLRPEKGLTFYGITTFSRRVVFVLDLSASMLERERPGRPGSSGRKIDAARRELSGAVSTLDDGTRFDVLLFEERVRRWEPALAPADRTTRDRAIAWARGEEPRGGTNIQGALDAAFALATAGVGAKTPNVGADTIFFLTDGRATAGRVQSTEGLVEAVRRWRRLSGCVVHCIGLGDHDEDLLAQIAAVTNGRYVQR